MPNLDPKIAIVARGPTAAGKSTIRDAVRGACMSRGHIFAAVTLDDGWGNGPLAIDFRPSTAGPARYPDLVNRTEDVLFVELAWGEPADGKSNGATKHPAEWSSLLQAERTVYAIRLSGAKAELSARRNARDGKPYEAFQDRIWKHVEEEAGTHRFHAVTGFDELVIPIDNNRPAAEIAGVALRFVGLA
jgi:hypothetical protein